jgi:RimJ/RimL family protein N-acetyltransferase
MDLDALFADFPVLESPRLTLRRLVPADAADAATFPLDPEVGRHTVWWAMVEQLGLAGFLALVDQLTAAREFAVWGVVPKDAGRVCGFAGLVPITAAPSWAAVGYGLARGHWGRGYAREAAGAVVDCGLARLRRHRLEASTSVENAVSGRVLDARCFRREGVLREHTVLRGASRDRAISSLLRREWPGMGH